MRASLPVAPLSFRAQRSGVETRAKRVMAPQVAKSPASPVLGGKRRLLFLEPFAVCDCSSLPLRCACGSIPLIRPRAAIGSSNTSLLFPPAPGGPQRGLAGTHLHLHPRWSALQGLPPCKCVAATCPRRPSAPPCRYAFAPAPPLERAAGPPALQMRSRHPRRRLSPRPRRPSARPCRYAFAPALPLERAAGPPALQMRSRRPAPALCWGHRCSLRSREWTEGVKNGLFHSLRSREWTEGNTSLQSAIAPGPAGPAPALGPAAPSRFCCWLPCGAGG